MTLTTTLTLNQVASYSPPPPTAAYDDRSSPTAASEITISSAGDELPAVGDAISTAGDTISTGEEEGRLSDVPLNASIEEQRHRLQKVCTLTVALTHRSSSYRTGCKRSDPNLEPARTRCAP